MQQQLKTSRKKATRSKLLNIKVTTWEEAIIDSLAKKFAGGNKSEWIRFASLNFQPRKKDLAPANNDDPNSPLILSEEAPTIS
jgi:hypothetical protein